MREALIDNPKLLRLGPAPAPAGIDDPKVADPMTVVMDIHNDSLVSIEPQPYGGEYLVLTTCPGRDAYQPYGPLTALATHIRA